MPTFTGDGGANTLTGGGDADTLIGLGGGDTLSGGAGADTIYGHSAGADGAIVSTVFATGFASPVAGATAFSDPGFLYIVEKDTGVIWRVDDDTGARTQFIDIANTAFSSDGERGVLGLAFHPTDANRFYVFLTDPQGDLQVRAFTRSADPAVANTASTLVIEIPKQTGQSNHNGGWIGFSPTDGYLYIATGDGGGGGDPGNNAQDLDDLLGKILRIDVNSDGFPADANRNYAIPANNPFVGVTGADDIYPYQNLQQVYDQFGVLAQETGLADNTWTWLIDYDETGTADYEFYQNIYDDQLRLMQQDGRYDNGNTWLINYDETDSQTWSSIRYDYDSNGVLINTTITPDDP